MIDDATGPTPNEVAANAAGALPYAPITMVHSRRIEAAAPDVWAALHDITFADIRVTRILYAIRRMNAPEGNIFDDGPLTLLIETPPQSALAGAITQPWRLHPARMDLSSFDQFESFDEPGWVKIATDFTLTAEGHHTTLTTRTHVEPTDQHAARSFRPYWIAIRPFSGFIRTEILTAVAKHATGAHRVTV
jgi:hypothetical protein